MFPTTEDGALYNVLPAFDHILMKLEAAKQQYAGYPRLAVCINLAWKKVDEYYSASDISPIYFVSSVLDPRLKLRYFEKNRKKKWLVGAREKLDDYMSEFKTRWALPIRRMKETTII
jgi:hypothetical protein